MKIRIAKIGVGSYWPNGVGPEIDTCPLRTFGYRIGFPGSGNRWPGYKSRVHGVGK